MTNAELDTAENWLHEIRDAIRALSEALRPYYNERDQANIQQHLASAVEAILIAEVVIGHFKELNRYGNTRGE